MLSLLSKVKHSIHIDIYTSTAVNLSLTSGGLPVTIASIVDIYSFRELVVTYSADASYDAILQMGSTDVYISPGETVTIYPAKLTGIYFSK